jgi:putative heme-binding domain-containing protein
LAEAVRTRFAALKSEEVDVQLAELTANLPSQNEELQKLVNVRTKEHRRHMGTYGVEVGAKLFEKHCAACHQLDGKGTLVGPQLDGIGNRGLERVVEDVLDPNRNVDVAFRTVTLALDDGTVVSGLFRREEGAVMVLVDNKGEEFRVPKDEVVEQSKTALSLMPGNVAELVNEDEFQALVAFLLSKRGPQNAAAK